MAQTSSNTENSLNFLTLVSGGGGTLVFSVQAYGGKELGPFSLVLTAGVEVTLLDEWPNVTGANKPSGPGTSDMLNVLSAPGDLRANWSAGEMSPATYGTPVGSGDVLGPFELRLPATTPSLEAVGVTLSALKIQFTGSPTGGSATVDLVCSSNPAQTASVVIPFNGTAYKVMEDLQTANALFSIANGTLFAFGQQALPAEICIFIVGSQHARGWRISNITTALTGGTSPAVIASCEQDIPYRDVAKPTHQIIFNGSGSPSSTGGSPVVTPNNVGGPTSSKKYLRMVQAAGASMSATFLLPYAQDMSESVVEVDLFAVADSPVAVSIAASGASPTFPPYMLAPKAWTTLTVDLGRRTGTQTAVQNSAVDRVTVRMGSVGSEQPGDLVTGELLVGEIRVRRSEPARIYFMFDDATIDHYNLLLHVAKQFPRLNFGVGVISTLVGSGGYCDLTQLRELNALPNVFLFNHTLDHGNRVSSTTQNYETGIDPLSTGQATGEFVFGWKAGAWPASGVTRLNLPNGQTGDISWNSPFDAMVPLIKAVHPEAVVTTEGWNGSVLGGGMLVRIKLANTGFALPTSTNTTNYVTGWAYSVDEITRQYKECADWLLANGLSKNGSHLITATPLGSFGPAVLQALKNAGITAAFQAGHVSNKVNATIRDFFVSPYLIPRVDINDSKMFAVCAGSAIGLGGLQVGMGHTVITPGATTTNPAAKNLAELVNLCTFLSALEGKAFVSTTPMEELAAAVKLYGTITYRDYGNAA